MGQQPEQTRVRVVLNPFWFLVWCTVLVYFGGHGTSRHPLFLIGNTIVTLTARFDKFESLGFGYKETGSPVPINVSLSIL